MKTAKLAIATSLLLAISLGSMQQAHSYDMKGRIESAKQIIAQNNDFKLRAEKFHAESEANIKEADKLRGEAEKIEQAAKLHAGAAKMDPSKMKGAVKQFNSDVQQFSAHAEQYVDHLKRMQASIGECHADADQYQINLAALEMHVEQYHIPAVRLLRPPHVCGAMRTSAGEARHYAGQLMMDQNRVASAEASLAAVEGRLQQSMNESPGLQTKALREARREEVEQAVAAEYARLRDEFKSLEIERAALANSGVHGAITATNVSAKLKSK